MGKSFQEIISAKISLKSAEMGVDFVTTVPHIPLYVKLNLIESRIRCNIPAATFTRLDECLWNVPPAFFQG